MGEPAEGIRRRHEELSPALHERGRRLFAATEARAYGHGGVSVVSRITGMARSTIERGMREIEAKPDVAQGRSRRAGGGRKAARSKDAALLPELNRLVEPATRGDPMGALRWTSKSLRHLSAALKDLGHAACPHVVADCHPAEFLDFGTIFLGTNYVQRSVGTEGGVINESFRGSIFGRLVLQ